MITSLQGLGRIGLIVTIVVGIAASSSGATDRASNAGTAERSAFAIDGERAYRLVAVQAADVLERNMVWLESEHRA